MRVTLRCRVLGLTLLLCGCFEDEDLAFPRELLAPGAVFVVYETGHEVREVSRPATLADLTAQADFEVRLPRTVPAGFVLNRATLSRVVDGHFATFRGTTFYTSVLLRFQPPGGTSEIGMLQLPGPLAHLGPPDRRLEGADFEVYELLPESRPLPNGNVALAWAWESCGTVIRMGSGEIAPELVDEAMAMARSTLFTCPDP